MDSYKLIIFDVDGTLVTTRSGNTFRSLWRDAMGRARSPESDWKWLPGRLERLDQLIAQGITIACATNQGGVAYGLLQWPALWEELGKMAEAANIPEHRIYVCYTHPHGSIPDFTMVDNRRKPGSGMLEEAMEEAHVLPSRTLSVGDRPEDEEAAMNAGCAFVWAKDFFGDDQAWSRFRVQVIVDNPDDPDETFDHEDVWVKAKDAKMAHEYIEEQYSDLIVLDVFTESGERCVY